MPRNELPPAPGMLPPARNKLPPAHNNLPSARNKLPIDPDVLPPDWRVLPPAGGLLPAAPGSFPPGRNPLMRPVCDLVNYLTYFTVLFFVINLKGCGYLFICLLKYLKVIYI